MSDIIKQLLLQFILILLNAFFAATEIAVISLNEKKLKVQAEGGNKRAVKMLKMIEEPTQFLSTIQIGITLAGFLGSAFAADNFAERLSAFIINTFKISESYTDIINTAAVIVITIILSFFTLVLGELVPKRVAMQHKERLAEGVCGIISGLAVALKPVIWLLTVSTNSVIRIFGIAPYAKEEPVSKEDIVLMLDAGADEGSLDKSDIRYIKNVFKFDGITAGKVMTPRKSVVFIEINSTEDEIVEIIRSEGYSRMPVYSKQTDNIVGILHTRDYLLKRSSSDFSLEQVMYQPIFIPETAHLDILFREMQKEHNHIAVVVNEYGEAAGIVTMEDILEELVGEIWDESDEAINNFENNGNNTFNVRCSTPIESFFEFFNIESESEATTVNGWLTEVMGSIPQEGNAFDYENLTITVIKADDLMAHKITVRKNEKSKNNVETTV